MCVLTVGKNYFPGPTEHLFQDTGDADENSQELNTELFEAALSLPKVKIRECLVQEKRLKE